MRIFARNHLYAKSRFWYFMKRQNNTRNIQGEIISVNELREKKTGAVKNYGIVLRYSSRTATHNMYKEFRDTTLSAAVGQLYTEMAGRHRAQEDSIYIIKTCVVTNAEDLVRAATIAINKTPMRFPKVVSLPRAATNAHKITFFAKRPSTFHS
jgi:large subunit ribosomal protein L18Ae